MKKYTSLFTLISLCASSCAFGAIGSGLYLSAGAGAGWLDVNDVTGFDLDYETLFSEFQQNDLLNEAVLNNFNNTATYEESTDTVLAGRAALGYLWKLFEGEPHKFAGFIYTVNATLGLEVGYRIFDKTDSTFEKIIPGLNFDTVETVTTEVFNQAIDASLVARLPFTEDSRFALLLKGGVAYNIYAVETSIDIEATEPPPSSIVPYNRTVSETQRTEEWLPVVGGGLEYMMFDNFGISAEYSAIFGSSDNANSQLLSGNLILRI